jgi:hypothetical protein
MNWMNQMVLRMFLFHGCPSRSGVLGLVPKIAAKKLLRDNSHERFRPMTGLYRVGSNSETCWVLFEIGRSSLGLENMIAIVGWGAPGCVCTYDAFGNQPSAYTTPTFCRLLIVSSPNQNSPIREQSFLPNRLLCSLRPSPSIRSNAMSLTLSNELITPFKSLAS